jgi:hypothetical protein
VTEPVLYPTRTRAPFGEAYEKSDKAALVAVAVAVFAVIKEQRATALLPVRLFIVNFPNS